MLKSDLSVLVDQRLDRCACMCPMVVASECGLYCCTCLSVSAGHKSSKPALMVIEYKDSLWNKSSVLFTEVEIDQPKHSNQILTLHLSDLRHT